MKLYFTRHGKTQWNQEKRFQGMGGDSPLLAESYAEIKALGKAIKEVPFEKIYSSTSKRASDTAQGILAELNEPVEIVYTDDLRELGLGSLEGQLIEEIRKTHGENLDNLRHHLEKYDPTPFGAEPMEHAIARIESVVRKAVSEASEGPLLFVGHGAALTAAIQSMVGKPLEELRAAGGLLNSSLTILETNEADVDGPYQMKLWNDVCFLEK
ncbi:phosphoglycerate mutase [Enterococcus sp. JM4C]|uniref:histidine phosphatase family protein n=1 Tax=Candidatus Enterococcus huntleyi TaxID=1857217 RepID=UPI00137A31A7|nr:histidine phosphatase family protein [Enterococcus sp. JM4C]KAF1296398.1 phosphoglycerate mutase [Enterococcus sp. JM4C]